MNDSIFQKRWRPAETEVRAISAGFYKYSRNRNSRPKKICSSYIFWEGKQKILKIFFDRKKVGRVSLSFHQKQFQSGVIWFEKSFKSFLLILFFAAIVDVDLSRWTNTNKVEPKWKWKCRVESFFALGPTNASYRNLKSLWVLVEFLIKNQINVSVNISRYKCNNSLYLMSTLVLKSCAMYE